MSKSAQTSRAGKPRKSGVRALGQLVPGLIAPAAKKYGFSSADLIGHWPAIVGEDMAAICTPERISWPRRAPDAEDGSAPATATLVLRALPQHVLQASHETATIADRVNAYFGYEAIGKVTVRRGEAASENRPRANADSPANSRPPAPEPVTGVRDEGLRAALGELGGHVRKKGE